MRSSLPLALLLCLLATPSVAEDTLFWIGVRTGLNFYNETDPDPLEDLATKFSIEANGGGVERRVEFDDKRWEIPISLRLGLRASELINLYGFYERLPYRLESSSTDEEAAAFPLDSVRLDLPANVFGLGVDFRLGTEGYGNSLLFGFAAGRFETEGDDTNAWGLKNFEVTGRGFYWEVSLAGEFEFTDEISFYPFALFRSATTDEVEAVYTRRQLFPEPVPPAFEIDYTSILIGIETRFRLYPWDTPEEVPEVGR